MINIRDEDADQSFVSKPSYQDYHIKLDRSISIKNVLMNEQQSPKDGLMRKFKKSKLSFNESLVFEPKSMNLNTTAYSYSISYFKYSV